jgi:hypothetical protein
LQVVFGFRVKGLTLDRRAALKSASTEYCQRA